MDDFQFTAPTKKEIEENKSAGSEPLQGEDYIAKIGKVRLEKKAGWSNGVMNPNIQQLMYSLILLPYKLKAEDGMIDIAGNKVEPLTQRLFKDVNPGFMGFKKTKEPSDLRTILAVMQGLDPSGEDQIAIPKIVLLDKDENVVTDETKIKTYKEQYKAVAGGGSVEDFTMRKEGYKYVPDLRAYEGKYIAVKVIVDQNAKGQSKNKVVSFGRVPSSFKPDETLEKEAMEKFAERVAKIGQKSKQSDPVNEIPAMDDIPF